MKSCRRIFKLSIAYPALLISFLLVMPLYVNAISSKDRYHIAESCYKKLCQDPSGQKYREHWIECITKYQDVFRNNPNDPWAAAGLYMSGVLYHELFKKSGLPSDQKEAVDTFQRIIKRYPSSKYKQRAKESLNQLIADGTNDNSFPKMTEPTTEKLPSAHGEVRNSEPLSDNVQFTEPDAGVESDMKGIAHKKSMKNQTRKMVTSEIDKPPVTDPSDISVLISEAANHPPPAVSSNGNLTMVTGLRYWSNPNYTRLVIDADGDTSFEGHLLKPDPELNTPRRLYVDLTNARLGNNVEKNRADQRRPFKRCQGRTVYFRNCAGSGGY